MIRPVLDRYAWPHGIAGVEQLGGGGGFSGAELWRIRTNSSADYCLRRWPLGHPSRKRLEWIHSVLGHVYRQGLRVVAAPLPDRTGSTIVESGGRLWELCRWMTGQADFHRSPTQERFSSAMQTLSRFHIYSATLTATFPAATRIAVPECVLDRARQIQSGLAGLVELEPLVRTLDWEPFVTRALRVFEPFRALAPNVCNRLNAWCTPVPLQPCIRDIWHEHLFFAENDLIGMVDFGAMRIETVATDLARLLASLMRNDAAGWQNGLAIYESIRRLDSAERELVGLLDASAVLLAPLNWMRWVCVERRTFERPELVLQRLDETLLRLEHPTVERG